MGEAFYLCPFLSPCRTGVASYLTAALPAHSPFLHTFSSLLVAIVRPACQLRVFLEAIRQHLLQLLIWFLKVLGYAQPQLIALY